MNVVSLDLALLGLGIPFLLWVWRFRPRPLAGQLSLFSSTVQAQYSWLVSWSLAKFCIFVLAIDGLRRRPAALAPFIPYVVYVVVGSLAASLFWNIPDGVDWFYGDGRLLVSLFNFSLMALSTMSLAAAFTAPGGGITFWRGLRWLAVVHGLVFLYQYLAMVLGWPLIGISRPHGLTAEEGVADIAMFVSDSGVEILRPGGLAGEPKAVATIFGIILFAILHLGRQLDRTRKERALTICAAILSFFCFFAAFSTSAYFGMGAAFVVAATALRGRHFDKIVRRLLLLAVPAVVVLFAYSSANDVLSIASERTVDRLSSPQDPPVEASLRAMENSIPVALFGTGQGGSSFLVMSYLNSSFEYAYAPNIGFVLLAVESGIIGLLLFFGGYAILGRRALSILRADASGIRLLFFTASISAMILCLSGSGIPLGMPLSIAAMYAAQAEENKLESISCAE